MDELMRKKKIAGVCATVVGVISLRYLCKSAIKKQKTRRWWVRPWLRRRESQEHNTTLQLYQEFLMDGDVEEYRVTLRMSPEIYATLLNILSPALMRKHTNFRAPISCDARLSITLRYLALGESIRSISQTFRVGLSTVRAVIKSTCQAIVDLMMSDYVKVPSTEADWLEVAKGYEDKWNFSHVVGSLDGKHIRIVAPPNSGSLFYNYKDFFSIVLMAAVNAEYEFIFIDVGCEGRASDGGIWQRTSLHKMMQDESNPLNLPKPAKFKGVNEEAPYFLIADDAFRMSPFLLKPYPGHGLSRKQRIFNYRLCRGHRIVENTFGIMSSRFRLLLRSLEVQGETQKIVVLACCILHNFLRKEAINSYLPVNSVDQELQDGSLVGGAWRNESALLGLNQTMSRNPTQYAKDVRDTMADYFVSQQGEVPWQYHQALGE